MSMDDFSVYAVLGINDAPRKLLSIDKEKSSSVAVPPHVRQVVVFSHGRWGEHPGVIVTLNQTEGKTIRLEKLTTSTKCLFWECSGEDERNNGLTLTVTLEEVQVKGEFADGDCAQLVHSKKECTPKDSAAPPSAWETHGKRKRGQEEEIEEDTKGQENVCPDDSPSDGVTPNRRGRGRPRSGQKRLFTRGEDGANTRVPQSSKAKEKQARAPGTGSLVSPSGRWGQTLCPIDSKTAILIGGQGSRIQFCKDPIWKLCTEDMSWIAAETLAEGPTPEVRIGHTATFDPESKRIFVFGGSKHKKWFNDVHILDSQSWRWSTVEAQGKVPPLAYHSCSLFRGELFVLGGVFPRPHPEPDGCSDSLYIFNPEMAIWYQPIVNGDRPAPRSGHSACVLQGKIFMFGGWDTPVCFNDMHALDLGLMEFSAVETTGQPPSPRSWHRCAALSNSKFLLHGGYNGTSALSDTFVFDTDSSSWTMVVNSHLSAVPRAGHTIITMVNTSAQDLAEDEDPGLRPLAQTLFIFGGGDNEGSFFSDLITLPIAELV